MTKTFLKRFERRSSTRDPRRKIIVVSEGKLTEPDYLRALAKRHKTLIEVKRGGGVPMSLVDLAIEQKPRKRSKDTNVYDTDDEVWVIFDRDEHPRYREAIQRARDAKVEVAYSNPCFELWLALHFAEIDKPMSRHEMQNHLARLCGKYNKERSKTIPFNDLSPSVESAESRASKLFVKRDQEGNTGGNPSTSVYLLTRRIKELGGLTIDTTREKTSRRP